MHLVFKIRFTFAKEGKFRGGTRTFPTGGLTLPTRELKCDFQCTINAKNLRKNSFSPTDGGLACSDGGL